MSSPPPPSPLPPPSPSPAPDPQPPSPPANSPSHDLRRLEPVATLLRRIRSELGVFGNAADVTPTSTGALPRTIRISRAPGRIDVMGGIADYTGSLVCEGTLDRACAAAIAPRGDREVQVFSFNLLDEHQPFTLRIPLDSLADSTIEDLRRAFAEPGRKWAGYIAGCLAILHEQKLIDLKDPTIRGMDIAIYSTVPLGAGVSSSAAIEVATMIGLRDHLRLAPQMDPMRLAALCQMVENRIVGAPCGIMDQVTSCAGRAGALLKLLCQPHQLQGCLTLPQGIRVVGINTNVRHSVGGGQYGRTRTAAFMGHKIILEKIRAMGRAAGKELLADPMGGYLANLPLADFKAFFQDFLPERMRGSEFLDRYGPTIDTATEVQADVEYAVRDAADHHVHEADRVRNFVAYMEKAAAATPHTQQRSDLLDCAGHLMYASNVSYARRAMLGAPEADLLVDLVRANERNGGFYGAKITGGGLGGTVAVLCNDNPRVDETLAGICREYQARTGKKPEILAGTSEGAWESGTQIVELADE